MDAPTELMTRDEVAQAFAVGEQIPARWANKSLLDATETGRGRAYYRAEVESYFAAVGGIVDVVSPEDACAALGIHRNTLACRLRAGEFRTIRTPGGEHRLLKSEIDAARGGTR